MKLYLVRHGEAKPEEQDPERPLSDEGLADTKKVSASVKKMKIQVSSIIHSNKLRARQTATVFAEDLDPPEGMKEVDGLEPLADPSIWFKRLAEMEKDIMLIGHLPHLSRLTSHLLCQTEDERMIDFQSSGILCLERDETDHWSINWMIIPNLL